MLVLYLVRSFDEYVVFGPDLAKTSHEPEIRNRAVFLGASKRERTSFTPHYFSGNPLLAASFDSFSKGYYPNLLRVRRRRPHYRPPLSLFSCQQTSRDSLHPLLLATSTCPPSWISILRAATRSLAQLARQKEQN